MTSFNTNYGQPYGYQVATPVVRRGASDGSSSVADKTISTDYTDSTQERISSIPAYAGYFTKTVASSTLSNRVENNTTSIPQLAPARQRVRLGYAPPDTGQGSRTAAPNFTARTSTPLTRQQLAQGQNLASVHLNDYYTPPGPPDYSQGKGYYNPWLKGSGTGSAGQQGINLQTIQNWQGRVTQLAQIIQTGNPQYIPQALLLINLLNNEMNQYGPEAFPDLRAQLGQLEAQVRNLNPSIVPALQQQINQTQQTLNDYQAQIQANNNTSPPINLPQVQQTMQTLQQQAVQLEALVANGQPADRQKALAQIHQMTTELDQYGPTSFPQIRGRLEAITPQINVLTTRTAPVIQEATHELQQALNQTAGQLQSGNINPMDIINPQQIQIPLPVLKNVEQEIAQLENMVQTGDITQITPTEKLINKIQNELNQYGPQALPNIQGRLQNLHVQARYLSPNAASAMHASVQGLHQAVNQEIAQAQNNGNNTSPPQNGNSGTPPQGPPNQGQQNPWLTRPPGNGNTSPGNGNTSPGNGNTSPGNGNTSPGNGNTSPGNGNTSPGNGNTSPGNGNTLPGNGNTSPGNGNTSPGNGNTSPPATGGGISPPSQNPPSPPTMKPIKPPNVKKAEEWAEGVGKGITSAIDGIDDFTNKLGKVPDLMDAVPNGIEEGLFQALPGVGIYKSAARGEWGEASIKTLRTVALIASLCLIKKAPGKASLLALGSSALSALSLPEQFGDFKNSVKSLDAKGAQGAVADGVENGIWALASLIALKGIGAGSIKKAVGKAFGNPGDKIKSALTPRSVKAKQAMEEANAAKGEAEMLRKAALEATTAEQAAIANAEKAAAKAAEPGLFARAKDKVFRRTPAPPPPAQQPIPPGLDDFDAALMSGAGG